MIEGIPNWFTIPALILGWLIGAVILSFIYHTWRKP